jgi:CRISPR/Cas system type I-B associated protein Csh2 (Cas7 group RAMP superfamily)
MVMAQKVRQRLWNGVRNIPVRARKGGAGSKKIVFLYDRSHQLVENKGRRVQNEAKNEAKIELNEAKLEAKKSKNSAICAKRSEDQRSKGEALTSPKEAT